VKSIELVYSNELTKENVPGYALQEMKSERFTSYWENGVSYVFDRSVSKIIHPDLNPLIVVKWKDKKPINFYLKLFSNGKWGLFDFELNEVISPKHDDISGFKEMHIIGGVDYLYLIVEENNLKGLLNESFEYFIQPQYQYLSKPKVQNITKPGVPFFIAKKENKFGIIDHSENIHTPFKYDTIKSTISRLIYSVEIDTKQGFISSQHDILSPFEWEYLELLTSFDISTSPYDFIACYGKDGQYGLLNHKGLLTNLISEIPMEYTKCYSYYDENPEFLYIFQKNGKQGIINHKGEVIIKAEYDKIEKLQFDRWSEYYNKKTKIVYNENHGLSNNPKIIPISDVPIKKHIAKRSGEDISELGYGLDLGLIDCD